MIDVESSEQLEKYLQDYGHIGQSDTVETQLLTGGVSNKTVLVIKSHGDRFVIKQALEKLRVQTDWFSDPARIIREALGMNALAKYAPSGAIPQLLFLDEENYLLAMEAVNEPHENYKDILLNGIVNSDHVEQFAKLLSRLHSQSSNDINQLKNEFSDREYFKTLRLEPYYGYAATQVPEAEAFLGSLIQETLLFQIALVHGDYSPKNVLIWNDQVILLDHEVIHLGDPAFDCGFALTHYLSKALHLKKQRPEFQKAAETFWTTYITGLGSVKWSRSQYEERVVRQLLGCLLARVAGRSPLEYLSDDEKEKQKEIVISLIGKQPKKVMDLIQSFCDCC